MTVDYAGQRIGRLVVLRRDGSHTNSNGKKRALWRAMCDCGKEVTRQSGVLWRGGSTASCGCLQRELAAKRRTTHGMSGTPTFLSWMAMNNRCRNANRDNFKHYGGRGISVCERWMSFDAFLKDMGARHPGTSLDRIDPNGNYDPGNCRWATRHEQANNRRTTIRYCVDGAERTLAELSSETGLGAHVLWDRINRYGWTAERAVATPTRPIKRSTSRRAP